MEQLRLTASGNVGNDAGGLELAGSAH